MRERPSLRQTFEASLPEHPELAIPAQQYSTALEVWLKGGDLQDLIQAYRDARRALVAALGKAFQD